jgi:hypothetical protein
MITLLIPKIQPRQAWLMAKMAVAGALVSGCYGMIHDQLTYAISPEYFTHFKFDQFRAADFGMHDRPGAGRADGAGTERFLGPPHFGGI